MVQKKKLIVEKPLTEVELELMNAIWDLGDCTVKSVQTVVVKERELAYTSVATMMKILEQKGFLGSRKDDRAHTYFPTISRSDYEAASLKLLADNVFRGESSSMVMRLLSETKLTRDELKAIKKILNERMGK